MPGPPGSRSSCTPTDYRLRAPYSLIRTTQAGEGSGFIFGLHHSCATMAHQTQLKPIRAARQLLTLALWGGYCLLPAYSQGFSIARLDCVPFYGGAVFLTFFAWIGYFGLGGAVAAWQLVSDRGLRVRAWFALMGAVTVFYLVGFLPPLLQRCLVWSS